MAGASDPIGNVILRESIAVGKRVGEMMRHSAGFAATMKPEFTRLLHARVFSTWAVLCQLPPGV